MSNHSYAPTRLTTERIHSTKVMSQVSIDLAETAQYSLLVVSSTVIIFGGTLPYIFQYREMQKSQNARGFSLFVCLALLAANILRVMFWFGKRFEWQLLMQSIVMITCMLMMVHGAVRINRKSILPPHKHRSVWDGDTMSHFWAWSDVSSYLATIAVFTASCCMLTSLLIESTTYIETIGFLALFLEGNLGTPQLYANWKRHSTVGMSVRMVLLWFVGDISKTVYFIVRNTPPQFYICGAFQIGVDVLILCQVIFYKKDSAAHHKYDTEPEYRNSTVL